MLYLVSRNITQKRNTADRRESEVDAEEKRDYERESE